jgi:MYXO-CTERM domain-containing protein
MDEPHDNGEIIGETLWDLRTALQTKLGTAAGYAHFIKIYYSIVQRASDIPSTAFPEALAADDDDGDLTNGTPNECEIDAAFSAHKIADPTLTAGLALPSRDNLTISMMTKRAAVCPGFELAGVRVNWRVRDGMQASLDAAMTNGVWSVDLPSQPDNTVVEYQVVATLGNGESFSFPDNAADPFYQFYIGPVTPIYCADFETGAADWTHAGTPPETDEWQTGVPMGLGGDPTMAHGGTGVLGIDLTMDGSYPPLSTNTATTPTIDLMGVTAPRLQFYRWLGVEDGFYDRASISVNGLAVWSNFKSDTDPLTSAAGEINHVDKEWRFVDIDLSSHAEDGTLAVSFGLKSDPFLQLSGWNLDDVCIVVPAASCSSNCQSDSGGGCCSTGSGPGGPLVLGLVILGLVRRRRGSRSDLRRLRLV